MRNFFLTLLLVACSSSEDSKGPVYEHKPAEIKEIEDHLKNKFKTVRKEEPKPKKEEIIEEAVPSEDKNEIKVKESEKKEKKVEEEIVLEKNPEVKLPSVKTLSEADKKSKKFWDLFDSKYIYIGEESVLSATYLGVHAGDLSVKVKQRAKVGDDDVYYFYARATSAKFYKWVYQIDDVVESFVTVKDFVPLKYSLSQKESKKTVDHIELYDRQKLMTYFRYKKVKGEKISFKKEDTEIPYFSQDFLSAFFFIRGMPLRNKDIYLIPTTTKSKTWTMRAEVIKRERIRLSSHGFFKAIKLRIITKYDGEIAKQGDMLVWISNDKYRRILKFKSDFKIGAVTGELQSYVLKGKKIL